MKAKQHYLLTAMTIALIGCGGGGGGGSDSPATESSTAEAISAPEAMLQETIDETAPLVVSAQGDVATADLRVDRDFTLAQQSSLDIVVEQPGSDPSYLSVCTDFSESSSGYSVNYDSCVLRTAITDASTFSIAVPNDINAVLAVRWFYSDTQAPSFSLWERQTANTTLLVR